MATVTSDGYEIGTAVLLSSLAAWNRTLDATIVVLHGGLGRRASRLLGAIPGAELVRVGETLTARLDALVARHPELDRRATRFYSIEAFALEGFERVLFLDADVLCTGEVGNLLSRSAGLHACPDRAERGGMLRDADSFLPVPAREFQQVNALRTFNAGVMLIGGDLLTERTRDVLLEAMADTDWSRVHSGHTDQYVLNRVFRDRWRPLAERYNRFIAPRGSRETIEEDLSDAVFLHFVGRPKPWMGRAGPDWRRARGVRRQALQHWDHARFQWALACARRGDPAPLVAFFKREGLRLGARLVRAGAASHHDDTKERGERFHG